jgi:hypothetical protein
VAPVTTLTARAQRRLNLLPGEVVLAATRKHRLALLGRLTLALAVGVILTLLERRVALPIPTSWSLALSALLLLWATWIVWDWRDALYVLTTDRMVDMRCSPLLQGIRRAVPPRSVEDVTLRRVLVVGRLWNVGTLAIETGDTRPVCLRAVPAPATLQRRLLETVEATRRREQFQEQEKLAATLTDWFEEYHRLQLRPTD